MVAIKPKREYRKQHADSMRQRPPINISPDFHMHSIINADSQTSGVAFSVARIATTGAATISSFSEYCTCLDGLQVK
jgi:hypothetical protein